MKKFFSYKKIQNIFKNQQNNCYYKINKKKKKKINKIKKISK